MRGVARRVGGCGQEVVGVAGRRWVWPGGDGWVGEWESVGRVLHKLLKLVHDAHQPRVHNPVSYADLTTPTQE